MVWITEEIQHRSVDAFLLPFDVFAASASLIRAVCVFSAAHPQLVRTICAHDCTLTYPQRLLPSKHASLVSLFTPYILRLLSRYQRLQLLC